MEQFTRYSQFRRRSQIFDATLAAVEQTLWPLLSATPGRPSECSILRLGSNIKTNAHQGINRGIVSVGGDVWVLAGRANPIQFA